MAIRKALQEAEKSSISGPSFEKMPEMSGADIAKELGITRQAVSNTLKRAMGKVFQEMKKQNKDMTPFEIAVSMAVGWEAANTTAEMKKFFKLFPPKVRKEIETSAADYFSSQKK